MPSPSEVLRRIEESGLLSPDEVHSIQGSAEKTDDTATLYKTLIDAHGVTPWQIKRLEEGETNLKIEGGRYLLCEKIGQGGMGAVYKARHLRLNRDVALKMIDPQKVSHPNLIARFHREVKIASKLQHEHVVQALDVGEHEGTTFLVLEYVDGCDLAVIVKRDGPLEVGEAVAICVQAASGLAHAHGQGIVHRDIKPQNILLTSTGVAKVLDLGLARIVDEEDDHTALTQEGTVMGTVDYMAPEQARDTHATDSRGDVYSLGATLYYLLAGKPPFAGGTAAEKLLRLSSEDPPPLGQLRPDVPREVTDIVVRMMARRPDDRYQTMEDVVRALRPFAADAIQGRPSVTAAVQLAEGNFQDFDTLPTAANTPLFVPSDEPATSLLQQRKRTSNRPILYAAGAAVVVVAVLIGLFGWGAKNAVDSPSRPSASPSSDGATVPVGAPPAEIRAKDAKEFFGRAMDYAWSPDQRHVAAACSDGYVRIIDLTSGQCITQYGEHEAAVQHVAWSENGKHVVSSSDANRRIRVWAPLTGATAHEQQWKENPELGGLGIDAPGEHVVYVVHDRIHRIDCRKKSDTEFNIERDAFHRSVDRLRNLRVQVSDDHQTLSIVTPNSTALVFSGRSGMPVIEVSTRVAGTPPGTWGLDASLEDDGTVLIADAIGVRRFEVSSGEEVDPRLKLPEELRVPADQMLQVRIDRKGRKIRRASRQQQELVNLEGGTTTLLASSQAHYNLRFASPNLMESLQHGDYHRDTIHFDRGRTRPLLEFFDIYAPNNHVPVAGSAEQLVGSRYLTTIVRGQRLTFDLQRGDVLTRFPDRAFLSEDGILRRLESGRIVRYASVEEIGLGRFEVEAELEDYDQAFGDELKWTKTGEHILGIDVTTARLRVWQSSSGRLLLDQPLNVPANQLTTNFGPNWNVQFLSECSPAGNVIGRLPGGSNDGLIANLEDGTLTSLDVRIHYRELPGASLVDERFAIVHGDRGGMQVNVYDARTGAEVDTFMVDNSMVPLRTAGPLSFSPSGRFIVAGNVVVNVETHSVPWRNPEPMRSSGVHGIEPGWFLSENLILVQNHCHYQVWDWQANGGKGRKELEILLFPDGEWACVDASGNYRASILGVSKLLLKQTDSSGKARWLSPQEYQKETSWTNDPTQVGVTLANQSGDDD